MEGKKWQLSTPGKTMNSKTHYKSTLFETIWCQLKNQMTMVTDY